MIIVEALKRWFKRKQRPGTDWAEVQKWAEDRNFDWRHSRGDAGFVIEGRQGMLPWRLEWGPPQRDYVRGNELRLRAEGVVPKELQALVLHRKLRERLEVEVFGQIVGDLQTRLDTRTPPEVRWLVMYSPLGGEDMNGLRERWSAVTNVRPWLQSWLSGPIAHDLGAVPCSAELPVVLMFARGRFTLRVQLAEPSVQSIEPWLRLFESTLREARRVGTTGCESAGEETTQPGLFTPSVLNPERAEAH